MKFSLHGAELADTAIEEKDLALRLEFKPDGSCCRREENVVFI